MGNDVIGHDETFELGRRVRAVGAP
jgi:hypothetical protein